MRATLLAAASPGRARWARTSPSGTARTPARAGPRPAAILVGPEGARSLARGLARVERTRGQSPQGRGSGLGRKRETEREKRRARSEVAWLQRYRRGEERDSQCGLDKIGARAHGRWSRAPPPPPRSRLCAPRRAGSPPPVERGPGKWWREPAAAGAEAQARGVHARCLAARAPNPFANEHRLLSSLSSSSPLLPSAFFPLPGPPT